MQPDQGKLLSVGSLAEIADEADQNVKSFEFEKLSLEPRGKGWVWRVWFRNTSAKVTSAIEDDDTGVIGIIVNMDGRVAEYVIKDIRKE